MFMVTSDVFERRIYFMNAGMATAAKMPIIAATIMADQGKTLGFLLQLLHVANLSAVFEGGT